MKHTTNNNRKLLSIYKLNSPYGVIHTVPSISFIDLQFQRPEENSTTIYLHKYFSLFSIHMFQLLPLPLPSIT